MGGAPSEPKGDAKIRHWPTRDEVAQQFGVSRHWVRYRDGSTFHPQIDSDGTHRYDPQELALVAQRQQKRNIRARAEDPGTIAQVVFRRLDEALERGELYEASTKRAIVIEFAITPEQVRQLFAEFLEWIPSPATSSARPASSSVRAAAQIAERASLDATPFFDELSRELDEQDARNRREPPEEKKKRK